MTMHTIFFKENEGIFPDPIKGSQPELPLWSVVGSQPPPPPSAYDTHFLQSKMPFSGGRNLQLGGVAKDSDQVLAKKDTTQYFTISPAGDCRTAENGTKTTYHTTVPSLQFASMEYQEQLKLGLGQPPLICAQYPYNAEKCHGIYSAYGAQIEGQRIMLPMSMASNGGPIFVNAKQYNGIMRRRRSRAKAEESKNEARKIRKPYMHLSRHLHAVRRQRGSGGRFVHTKSSNATSEKKKMTRYDHRQPQSTESEMSEVLESSDKGFHSTKTTSSSSRGSEVTSYLHHHFEFDHNVQPSFQPFLDVGIANNYLKV